MEKDSSDLTAPAYDAPPAFTVQEQPSHPPPTIEVKSSSAPGYNSSSFPGVGTMPIPNVSPLTAHYHILLLRRFVQLYKAVEERAVGDPVEAAKLVQRFLCCAENRYTKYLLLLDECAVRFNKGSPGSFRDVMPLPPWDVAIVFHSHCLTPWRFYTDINRRGPALWSKTVAFPLERMASLIESSVWTDAESEKLWNDKYPEAYQLWDSDPAKGMTKLVWQDVQFKCPWCDAEYAIPLSDWTEIHTTKTARWTCANCQVNFNADTLSAKYLKDDLLGYVKTGDPWLVKGCIPGRFDADPAETGRADLGFILDTVLRPGDALENLPAIRMHLRTVADTALQPSWKDMDYSFNQTMGQLKGARLLRMLSRGNLFVSMRIAYQGILYKDFSIDLVAAALRQREFSKKITAPELEAFDSPHALDIATTRYHKFLLLMNRKSGNSKNAKKFSLVPTLDIDLCWHTHQLFAVEYRDWCVSHLGAAINHDDTVAKEDIDSGLKETSSAWSSAYRESYTQGSTAGKEKKFGLFSRRTSKVEAEKGKGLANSAADEEEYLKMYPYWLNVPEGWKFPAACANSGKAPRGWAASVDRQREATTMVGAKCAGCTSGCTYVWGD